MLLMIVASTAAYDSENEDTTDIQDGELESAIGQNEPNTLACFPLCMPQNGKRDTAPAAWNEEQTQDAKTSEALRRFQLRNGRLIVKERAFSSSTNPRLFAAFKRRQHIDAQHIWKDSESRTEHERRDRRQPLRARHL